MPFTTTLIKAFEASTQVSCDDYELDGGDAGSWDYGHGLIGVKIDGQAELDFRESQEIEINDAGLATVTDINGDSHDLTFECLHPLVASDID